MDKKPVYNGYQEKYLTGKELKQMYCDEFLGIKRHHASIAGIRINEYLDAIDVEDDITYRIFYNDAFCRVMDGEKDTLVDFFCHNKIDDIRTNFDLNNFHYDLVCPKCGSKMKYRVSKFGPFLGCAGYPNCKNTVNIPFIGEYAG